MSDKTISYETAEQATIDQFLKLVRQSNPYLVPLIKPMLNHAKPLLKEFYNLGMAHAQTPEHLVLDAPARVGGGVFRKGVSMLTVVAAAQRLYEYSSKEQPKPIISAADMLRVAAGELVLVPTNPTPKMIDATWDHDEEVQSMSHNARNEFIYKKMIEAWGQSHD